MKKQYILGLILLCGGLFSCSSGVKNQADFDVIPLPQEVQTASAGDFVLSNNTVIAYPKGNDAMKRNAEFLAEYIKEQTGKNVQLTDNVVLNVFR